jgi:type II secretory pathway pseudopilin PulG
MHRRLGGFTYLGVLFLLALIGMSLAAAGSVWTIESRRVREADLLWVGNQFRSAISSYVRSAPGGAHSYPRELADLIEDQRGPVVVRHLRQIYRDPITGQADWETIRSPDGFILGVASRSQQQPIKTSGFDAADAFFEQAQCYCDWRFVYLPQLIGTGAGIDNTRDRARP